MSDITVRAVYTTSGDFIPLKHVESFNETYANAEDATAHKLAGEKILWIRTLSGGEYEVSMKRLMQQFQEDTEVTDVDQVWTIVFDSWAAKIGLNA